MIFIYSTNHEMVKDSTAKTVTKMPFFLNRNLFRTRRNWFNLFNLTAEFIVGQDNINCHHEGQEFSHAYLHCQIVAFNH